MGFFSWLLFGLIAGVLAKWIMPGNNSVGIIMTIILGIIGAIVGGFIGTLIGFGSVQGFDIRSFFIAIVGALIVLFAYHKIRKV